MVPVRKALLIISGDVSECQIPAQRIRRFLFSPMGGGWLASEIHTLINPDLTLLSNTLKGINGDYTMTFFIGPSFHDAAKRKFLMVNDADFIHVDELMNDSPRQLLLLDVLTHARDLPLYATGTTYERIVARNLYSRWLERAPAGTVTLHTNHESSAMDTGFLTQLLLSIDAPDATTFQPRFKSILQVGLTMNSNYRKIGLNSELVFATSGNPGLPFGLVLPQQAKTTAPVQSTQAAFKKLFGLLFNTVN